MTEPKFDRMQCGSRCWVTYTKLKEGEVHRTVLLHPNLLFDFDKEGYLLGIETLGAVHLACVEQDTLEEVREDVE